MGSAGHARPIVVGFDGRALYSPAAGVRRYARELFGAMRALDAEVQLVALGVATADPVPDLAARRASIRLPTNLGWTLGTLPLTARGAGLDLYHGPAYTLPPWGMGPTVLSIHDVSYARHPEWYPYRRDPLRRAFYRASARAADLILTLSDFSRREIVAAYDIEPSRVVVIPLAAGAPFRSRSDLSSPSETAPRAPYVMHVGDLHPRRDLAVALGAVARVRARVPAAASLRLLAVGSDRGSAADLITRAAAAGCPDAFELRTHVDDDELANLYRGAVALVYPSRYEGFGLPLLEAMACGTPVLAARSSAIPEVVGEAALLIEPGQADAFADALEVILRRPGERGRLVAAGLVRAAAFSWRRTAEQTVDAYRRCLDLATRRRPARERRLRTAG